MNGSHSSRRLEGSKQCLWIDFCRTISLTPIPKRADGRIDDDSVSSRWKYYSDVSEMQVDEEADLVSLSGVAFGRRQPSERG